MFAVVMADTSAMKTFRVILCDSLAWRSEPLWTKSVQVDSFERKWKSKAVTTLMARKHMSLIQFRIYKIRDVDESDVDTLAFNERRQQTIEPNWKVPGSSPLEDTQRYLRELVIVLTEVCRQL